MKKILTIGIIFTIILNILGIYHVGFLDFGYFVLIGTLSLIASKKYKLHQIIIITLTLGLISLITNLFINWKFKYYPIIDNGEIVPVYITILAHLTTILLSIFLSLIVVKIYKKYC